MLYETSNTAHAAAGLGRTQAGNPPCVQVQVQVSVPTSARQLLRTGETVRSVTVTKPLEALQADVLQQVQSAAANSPHLGNRPQPPHAHPGTPTPHTRTAFSRGGRVGSACLSLGCCRAPRPCAGTSSPIGVPPHFCSKLPPCSLLKVHKPAASRAAPAPLPDPRPPQCGSKRTAAPCGGATAPAAGPAEAAAAHCDTESLPPMTRSYLASLRSLEPAHAPGDPRPSQHAAEAYLLRYVACISMSGCSDCPRLGADVLARCASQRHGMQ